jgi:hypothetical protein
MVSLSELVKTDVTSGDKAIYHKNLQPVVYITGDVVGRQESPVYAILKMNASLDKLELPGGVKLNVMTTHLPDDTRTPAMKWDGEWHITLEVFRDLGTAFAAVLLPFVWVTPTWQELGLLLVIGVLGGMAQVMLTEAWASAQVSALAPYSFSSLLWAILFGWIAFGDVPGLLTVVGATLIVVASLYILHREVTRRRRGE